MAKKDSKSSEAVQEEKTNAAVSRTETFYNNNKKLIWGIIAAVVVIGAAVLLVNRFYTEPKKAEAKEQMYPAEKAFRDGNYELALNGDGNTVGFAELAKEYGSKAGESVYFYAGVCALQLGQYQDAIDWLKKYDGKEPILAGRAQGCIGDAYVGLEDYAEAVKYFEQAAKTSDNVFSATYLLKAGVTYEELGQNDKALSCYETIKDQYPQSIEGYDIDKYIARIQAK